MLKKIFFLIPLFLSACSSPSNPPTTAPQINLKKYMGTWYEIASFPNSFQKGCRCTKAQYTFSENKVHVLNQCYKGTKLSQAKGTARPVSGSHNSKLKVQFFWPFRGDYWILYIDPHYKTVLVGSPKRNYLWILARTKKISASKYNKLINIAKQKGYLIKKLIKTKQNC